MLFDHLAKRHNILVEEQLGLDQCVVTSHNLGHDVEDILRFFFHQITTGVRFMSELLLSIFQFPQTRRTLKLPSQKLKAGENF